MAVHALDPSEHADLQPTDGRAGGLVAVLDRVLVDKGTGRSVMVSAAPALVLLVDDYPDNRDIYVQFLTYAGLRVEEADNGHQALDKAFTLQPDVIVMDLSLPGLDGWEATRRLKQDPRTRDIPVIALTGHALAGHSKGAFDAGCDAFITKPCLPERLLDEIRAIVPAARSRSGDPTP